MLLILSRSVARPSELLRSTDGVSVQLAIGQQTAYAIELGLVKSSLCLLFMRIFSTPRFKFAATCTLILCVSWAIMTVLIGFLSCRPLTSIWDPNVSGRCIDIPAAWTAIGSIDVILDTIILVLPIPMLWKLQMPVWRKWAVTGIFGMGIV